MQLVLLSVPHPASSPTMACLAVEEEEEEAEDGGGEEGATCEGDSRATARTSTSTNTCSLSTTHACVHRGEASGTVARTRAHTNNPPNPPRSHPHAPQRATEAGSPDQRSCTPTSWWTLHQSRRRCSLNHQSTERCRWRCRALVWCGNCSRRSTGCHPLHQRGRTHSRRTRTRSRAGSGYQHAMRTLVLGTAAPLLWHRQERNQAHERTSLAAWKLQRREATSRNNRDFRLLSEAG